MKYLKNIFLFLFIISISILKAQPVKIYGQLKVVGTQLVDKNNNPIVLRGMSFGWSCFHPRFYNAGAVKSLYKDWNCSVVRAAMGVEPVKGYIKDSATSVQTIKAVVDAAIKVGIYVIIDWHSHHVNLKEAKVFFANMAATYGKYPNIIYEVFNEPAQANWPEVKEYATEIIKVIRSKDLNNVILVGCPHWDQDINLPAADPIIGFKNLMYTMHFYAGTHKQWLRDRTDSAMNKGLPIFVSESAGMDASGDGPINEEEWKKWITWMDAKKLSWITWSVSDKNETCSVLQVNANSDGKWPADQLKIAGKEIKERLKSYHLVK